MGDVKTILETIDTISKLIYALLVLVSINLITTGLKFFFDFNLKKYEKNINKAKAVIEKSILVTEKLYQMLLPLTNYGNTARERATLLRKITEIERYIISNNLYLEKDIIKRTNELLDYYKKVLNNYNKKNYETEGKLLSDFIKIFKR